MNYDVILNANDSATLETQYSFTQGDYGQIQFSIRVKADGQYITNAQRAYIVFTLSNGMIVTGADMPKSAATYTYVFKGNELQSPGKVVADVKLVYANGQISSNKFTFICRFDPLADKSVPAAPYITVLQQIVDEGQEKIDYLQALIDSMQGGIGATALTRNDLQNTRNPISAGAKAIDAQLAQFLLLKEDLVNQFLNDSSKPASAALAYSLNQSLATTNMNLANVGTIYSGIVSGSPSTTDVVLGGSIQLPQGQYFVVLSIGTIEPQYFQQLSIRTGSDPSSSILATASKKSSCLTTVLDLSSSTYVYPFAQMSQTTTISSDYRFNYLKAIRIK